MYSTEARTCSSVRSERPPLAGIAPIPSIACWTSVSALRQAIGPLVGDQLRGACSTGHVAGLADIVVDHFAVGAAVERDLLLLAAGRFFSRGLRGRPAGIAGIDAEHRLDAVDLGDILHRIVTAGELLIHLDREKNDQHGNHRQPGNDEAETYHENLVVLLTHA